MNCRNRVTSCKRGDWRLLDKDFKSKPIKEGIKFQIDNFKIFKLTKSLK